jgi:hypothetical protein
MGVIKRIILWFQIRSLEATIYGREQLYPLIRDKLVLSNMELLNGIALSELRRLKREYREQK